MSFLHDHEVYLKVIDGAFNKLAQQAATDVNQVAKKLVSRLSRESAGGAEAPNVSSGTSMPVGLTTNDLQNIGNLLKFLDTNQIQVDGERVVYDEKESAALAEGEQNKLSPVTINVSRDAASRRWNTADYNTNLPALIKYVSYLKDKAKADDNKVMTVMVGKLIDQVNTIKPDSGLSRVPKSVPGTTANTLPDETVIDGFASKVFDAKSPKADNGNYTITAKDLKSKETFNAWMLSNPEAQTITYDKDGKKVVTDYTDPNADVCLIINKISDRAQNLARKAKPEDVKRYNYYVQKIQEIGQSFSCTVGGSNYQSPVGGETTLVSDQTKIKTEQGSSERTNVDDQVINNIVSSFPLAIADINLDRIFDFANQVKVLSSGARASRTSSYIADLTQQILHFKNLTTHQDTIIPLNTSPQIYAGTLKNVSTYYESLSTLQKILDLTRKLMLEFNSAYGNKLDDQEKTTLLGQIGRGPTDNSIFMRNMQELDSLKRKINQVLRVTHGK